MRKNKALLFMLLGCIMASSMAFTACISNYSGSDSSSADSQPSNSDSQIIESSDIELVDFEDETISVAIGDTYTLPNDVVLDTNDNDYPITYTVKNQTGEEISVINNQFIISEAGGYVITCVATLPDGKTEMRTITLTVSDSEAPTIAIGACPIGYVNKEYVLPTIIITDADQNGLTSTVKVYAVGDETEIAVSDGKFTPTVAGEYVIKVNAQDGSGNTSSDEVKFIVRGEMAPFVLEDFQDNYGTEIFTMEENGYNTEDAQWLDSFDPTPDNGENADARNGVASVAFEEHEYGPHFCVRLPQEMATADFGYVYVRAYIKSAVSEYVPTVKAHSSNEFIGEYNVNEWVEIRIAVEDINSETSWFSTSKNEDETAMECFRRMMTQEKGAPLFWFPTFNVSYTDGEGNSVKDSADNYTVYVDEIGYRPVVNPEMSVEESYELGEYVTLNATVDTDLDESEYALQYTVTDPSGNSVSLDAENKFRLMEVGDYTVSVKFIHESYGGENTYTLHCVSTRSILVDEFTGAPKLGDTVTLPNATFEGGEITTSVKLDGCDDTIAVVDGAFVAGVAGTYKVTYQVNLEGLIYKTEIDITVTHELGKGEVLGFNKADDLNATALYNGVNANSVTWLPAYNGEYGVAKYTFDGEWPFITFTSAQAKEVYENGALLVIRAYVASGAVAIPELILSNGEVTAKSGACVQDQWVDYTFDIAPFLAYWFDGNEDVWTSNARIWWFGQNTSDIGMLYISDIKVVYSAQASGITVAVDGEKQAGEELTVTMNVPEGVTGATLVVRNSDGETITLTDNKFAPKAGTYTVEISCDGYDLAWTQTFEVVPIDITMDVAESYELGSYLTLNAAANTSVQGEMQYTVLDPDGEEVAVTENQFRFMKTGEYTVTAKFAHDLYGVEEVFTLNCVSTLSVEVDEYVGSPKVGETVTLPTATFDGNSAGITVGVKLDGYDYTVETENNTFIANVAGKYVVTYTKDDDGFIYNKAIEIEVGYEVVENEVLGFNQASDLNNTALYNTVNANSVTWLPAYNGEYGVAKYTFDGEWPFITFTPAQAKAAYEEGNNCIVIRAYVVDGEAAIPELILSNGEITAKSGSCTYGEWVDYKFDIAPFLAYWFEEVENVWDSNARIWWFGKNVSASGEIYIADIKVAYDEAFEKDDENEGGEGGEGGEVVPVTNPVFFDMANASSLKFSTDVADGTMEYIDATKVAADTTLPAIPEGESGYMKLSGTAAAWNALPIFLTPQAGADVVSQYSYLEFWYYNPNGGRPVVAGNWSEVATGADAQWYKVSISIADYYAANNADWYNALSSWLPFLQFRGTGGGAFTTVYISSVYLVK